MLRLYTGEDEQSEKISDTIQCLSGHCYVSGLMPTRHQVVHPLGVSGGDSHKSRVLGTIEVVIVLRCSVLNYNRMSNAACCYNNGIDGFVCQAVSEAVSHWQLRNKLVMPSLTDILETNAQAPTSAESSRKRPQKVELLPYQQ